jgi:hypothetical protein
MEAASGRKINGKITVLPDVTVYQNFRIAGQIGGRLENGFRRKEDFKGGAVLPAGQILAQQNTCHEWGRSQIFVAFPFRKNRKRSVQFHPSFLLGSHGS